jgi:hypothetical protein
MKIPTFEHSVVVLSVKPGTYKIFLHDRGDEPFSIEDTSQSRGYMTKIDPTKGNVSLSVFSVKVNEIRKLNTGDMSCSEENDYEFGKCVRKTLLKNTTCQLPWNQWEPVNKGIQYFKAPSASPQNLCFYFSDPVSISVYN